MSEPITEAMLEAGDKIIKSWDIGSLAVDVEPVAEQVFRAMVAARDAGKVELTHPRAKDLILRLAMGEQPDMERDGLAIRDAREHRLIEAGTEQAMVRWGNGDLTPIPPGSEWTTKRMFFRLTEKGTAWIAKETANG